MIMTSGYEINTKIQDFKVKRLALAINDINKKGWHCSLYPQNLH